MIRHIIIAGSLFLAALPALAQQPSEKMKRAMDSIKAVYIDMAALRNPVMRQAGMSVEGFGSGRVTSRLHDNPLFKGRMQMGRVTAWFNMPVAHIGKNMISTAFIGRRQTIKLSEVESYDPALPVDNTELDKTTISLSVSATRIDSLFNRPVVYSVTASSVADPETWQNRFVFTGLVLLTLKQTPTTSFSVGLLGLLDPSAPLPIIPFVRYSHKFKRPQMELFFDPSRVALRKELSPRHFLWLSNDIGGNVAMFKLDNDKIPHESLFTTLELKSGLMYEYRLTRKTIISLNGGICSTLTSKITEQNKNRDPFIKNKQAAVPYAQISVSCLPFWKGLVKR